MIQTEEESIVIKIPKQDLRSIELIISSKVLRVKGATGFLHFDNRGKLKIIEYPQKFTDPN